MCRMPGMVGSVTKALSPDERRGGRSLTGVHEGVTGRGGGGDQKCNRGHGNATGRHRTVQNCNRGMVY